MTILQVLLIAALIEAVVENLIWTFPFLASSSGKTTIGAGWDKPRLVAFVTSIALCLLAQIDLFPLFGISLAVPYVGNVFTGVLLCRGANAAHALIQLLDATKLRLRS